MNREAAVKNTFNVRVVGVSLSVAALVIGFAGCRAAKLNSEGDDRSRIIVRSGSLDFEQNVEWEYDSTTSKKKAHSSQPNGAPVTGFQVTFARQDIEHASCPQAPMVGDSVVFQYKTTTPQDVTLGVTLVGGTVAPDVDAPGDMIIDGSKKKLSYDPSGSGSIVKVTVRYNGADQECVPNDGKFKKPIDVKPLR